jgi:hypothetical protein
MRLPLDFAITCDVTSATAQATDYRVCDYSLRGSDHFQFTLNFENKFY